MSKKNINLNTRVFLTKRAYEYLAFNKDISVIIFPLTEEIKTKINNKDEFALKLPNYRTNKYTVFKIRYSNIGFSGKLDLSINSNDLKVISEYSWYDRFKNFGQWLYSTFDYETCSISKEKPQLQYETYNVANIIKYIHAILNYPEELVIAEIVNKETYELNRI